MLWQNSGEMLKRRQHKKGISQLVGTDKKICNVCGEIKLLSAFHPNKRCSGGVTGTCRDCECASRKAWYARYRDKQQALENARNHARKVEIVKQFGGKCHDCSGVFPVCAYDFHHLDPTKKDIGISNILRNKKKMAVELEKCILLCSNCHRIRHWKGHVESID